MGITLVFDNIRSLHNVGAIFRSADACQVERIILTGITPCPPRPEIEKTALGATRTVPWQYVMDIERALAELAPSHTLYALEQTDSADSVFSQRYQFPATLVIGHERLGVSLAALKRCSAVQIPMYGASAHSLNVATATGITLYAMREQLNLTALA